MKFPTNFWMNGVYLLTQWQITLQDILFGRKVVIYGDPDLTTGIARFVGELGMEPTMVCTGVKSPSFAQDMEKIAKETGNEIDVLVGQDLRAVEVYLKENPADLMIGNSDGRLISLDQGIPLIRVGFPVYDRVGYQRQPILGYQRRIISHGSNYKHHA